VLLPDGRRTAVPFVSGNSLRHELRSALAWHLVRTLEVPWGSLPKAVVDLLWSGGSLSATGSAADLGLARRVHETLPSLGLLGYSARSDITAGTLAVDNVHVVCEENAWRLPAPLKSHPHAALTAGAARSEEFGTRHDVSGTPVERYIALLEEAPAKTTQMIYDAQVIKAGAVLFTGLRLLGPTAGHVAALATALDEAAPLAGGERRVSLGGKRSAGFGACVLGERQALGDGLIAELRAAYEEHLRANRGEALTLLREVTG
jgi:hypothetical protein